MNCMFDTKAGKRGRGRLLDFHTIANFYTVQQIRTCYLETSQFLQTGVVICCVIDHKVIDFCCVIDNRF